MSSANPGNAGGWRRQSGTASSPTSSAASTPPAQTSSSSATPTTHAPVPSPSATSNAPKSTEKTPKKEDIVPIRLLPAFLAFAWSFVIPPIALLVTATPNMRRFPIRSYIPSMLWCSVALIVTFLVGYLSIMYIRVLCTTKQERVVCHTLMGLVGVALALFARMNFLSRFPPQTAPLTAPIIWTPVNILLFNALPIAALVVFGAAIVATGAPKDSPGVRVARYVTECFAIIAAATISVFPL